MHQENELNEAVGMVFEPSRLVEYGEARERTQGAGAPQPQQDGAQYNS